MADELFRIEIPIVVSDETGRPLQAAESRINRFEKSARRTNDRLRKMFGGRFAPVIDLIDRTRATVTRIHTKLRGLTNRAWKVTMDIKDKVTGRLKGIAQSLLNPLAILGAGAGATVAISFPLRLAGEMEQARIAMEFFTESAEKGQKFLERIQTFAARTPFEFPQLREAAVGLMPLYKNMYGVDKAMDETMRTIQAFGDAAGLTGAGIQGMERAMLGFRQIGTMGRLTMQELRQVTENLLIPMDIIQKELGITADEMMNLASEGIDARTAMEGIIRALEKNFTGGMDKMSQSLMGLTSTLKDTARLTILSFGEGMATPVRRVLLDMVGLTDDAGGGLERFQETLRRFGERVGETFERTYHSVKEFWNNLSADPAFQKLEFGDKIIHLLNMGLDGIINWLNGEGGKRFQEIFGKLGEIAARAWAAGLQGALTRMWGELQKGNIFGAGAMAGLIAMMGGGLIGKAAIGAGKGLWSGAKGLGSWIFGTGKGGAAGAGTAAAAGTGAGTAAATSAAAHMTRTAKAAARAAQEAKLSSKIGGVLGRAALPIGVGLGAYDVLTASPADRAKTAWGAGGRLAGAWSGAKLGASGVGALGTLVAPGVGTGIGAAIGGIGGGIAGAFGGEAAVRGMYDFWTSKENERHYSRLRKELRERPFTPFAEPFAPRMPIKGMVERQAAALATGAPAQANISLNVDLAGLISNVVINNQNDIDRLVEEATNQIGLNLRKSFNNMGVMRRGR